MQLSLSAFVKWNWLIINKLKDFNTTILKVMYYSLPKHWFKIFYVFNNDIFSKKFIKIHKKIIYVVKIKLCLCCLT